MDFFYQINPSPETVLGKVTQKILASRRAGMTNAVTGIEAEAVRRAPVKTSNLTTARTTNVSPDGSWGTIRFTAKYAEYVHEGTGLYGPHKTKIVPKTAKALCFRGSDGSLRFVRSVKGMKGRPFLTDAAESLDLTKLYSEGAENFLKRGGI